jgi:hypothetical protein
VTANDVSLNLVVHGKKNKPLAYRTPDEFARQWQAASLTWEKSRKMWGMISYAESDEEWGQGRL